MLSFLCEDDGTCSPTDVEVIGLSKMDVDLAILILYNGTRDGYIVSVCVDSFIG